MTVALWGGGTTDDLADRIRSGDVAIDLYRPVPLLGWYLAADLGRASYHFLTRGLAPTVVGAVLFHIRWPGSPVAVLAVLVSIALAVVVSFALRFLAAATSFWLLDAHGARTLSGVLALFWSGMVLPLVVFPSPLKEIAFALPWASRSRRRPTSGSDTRAAWDAVAHLGLQALWAAVLLGGCQLLLHAATRKVVVQGG